jgi:multiple sugar transport system permease protein
VLTAVVVFSFISHWNDFFGPLIYLNSRDNWTLTLGLAALSDPNYVDYNQRMAGAFLISLPCVVVFFLAQRYFTEGIVMTGIKA